jgi:hypothetical protein
MASRVPAPESLQSGNAHDIPEPRLPDFQTAVADAVSADTALRPASVRLTACRGKIPCDPQYVAFSFEISYLLRIHSGKLLAVQLGS